MRIAGNLATGVLLLVVAVLLWLLVHGCSSVSPMVYDHGVPNFDRVTDRVWRSGQISTAEGWRYLHDLANGRALHVIKLNFDAEGRDLPPAGLGIDVIAAPIDPEGDQDIFDDVRAAFRRPNPNTLTYVERTLEAATDRDVYLVHCTHGQDRTGLVIGIFRVLHDRWTKDRAYTEMRAHHFHPELHGLHKTWEDFRP